MGWLLSKANELKSLKGLFSKDRSEGLRKAREELQDNQEEAEFYDEALRQEIFDNLIGIRCCKEYREIYQRLVSDGVASTEGIVRASSFIYKKGTKIEVRFTWFDWSSLIFYAFMLLLGSVGMPLSLFLLLRNFSLATFQGNLFVLSISMLCFFIAFKEIASMVAALGIRSRLKKWEEKNSEALPSPSTQVDATCEQSTQNI